MADRDPRWLDANQGHLSTEIALVRLQLEVHAARARGESSPEGPQSRAAMLRTTARTIAEGMPSPPAIDEVAQRFGLTPFERTLLVLCAAVELDSSVAGACAQAHGDPQRGYPTFGLALAALAEAHWSALVPDAPLRSWRLIEAAPSGGSPSAPLTSRPLRIDERVLHHLTGLSHLDERLAAVLAPTSVDGPPAASHRAIADAVVATWTRAGARTLPVVVLHGGDAGSARAVAAFAADACGWMSYRISERAIPSSAIDLHPMVKLWERETRLRPAALVVECDGHAEPQRDGVLRDLVDRTTGPVIIVSRDRQQPGTRPTASFEIGRPTPAEQRGMWIAALAARRAPDDDELDVLTSQFSLNAADIASAAEEACAETNAEPSPAALWHACRRQARGRLEDLAQRIVSTTSLDDLVLPESQKEILQDVITHVRHRATVHDAWGFGGRGSRGLGISALFAGASGTGKTMAAEVLAGALALDLYRIDLSSVVSKYIGETEKNLRRIFDAADAGGVILLFDEADALFGKRSEVKDSHDRYANIEVSYLLQRMECYRGLAILTTNMKSALDVAFLRRIRFIVQFPFPDAAQRAEIWRRAFPSTTPVDDLDVERLAQLNVAGGSIRNVALNAAFLAADTQQPVGMSHLLRAARSEYAKLEKPLTDAEIAGWVERC